MLFKLSDGVFRIYMGSDIEDFFKESEFHNDWKSPTYWACNFVIAQFIPVSALLLSFWYGLKRRNKVIRSRKYSQIPDQSIKLGGDKSPNYFDLDDDDLISD